MHRRRFLSLLLVLCMAVSWLPGVSHAEASPALSLDTVATVTIDEAGEVAEFSFTPSQSGLYRFSSQSDDDSLCWLLDSRHNTLNLDDNSGSGNNFTLTALLTAGKTYYYQVECGDNSTTGTFEVLLTFLGLPTVTELTQDATATVTTDGEHPARYYSFTPTQSGDYILTADSGDDTFCRLYNGNWEQIGYGDDLSEEDGDFSLKASLTAGQTYYYEVRYYSNQPGSFQVCLTAMAPPPVHPLEPDTPTTVSITPDYPTAFYSFTPQVSGYYALRADSGGRDTLCTLYDSNGNYLLESDDGSSSLDFYLVEFLNAGETYRYEVQFLGGTNSGTFEILLTCIGAREEVALTPDIPTTVTIRSPGTSVFCTFTPTQSGYYAFSANSNGGDTLCWLYDAEGNSIAESDDGDTGTDFRVVHYLTAGERYTYEARYFHDEIAGTFTVLLTCLVPDQAVILTPGNAVTLTIPEPGIQFDCTFTPTRTGYYSITTTAENVAVNCILDYEAGDTFITTDNEQRNSGTVVEAVLHAGQTYTFRFYVPDVTYTGSFDIMLHDLGEPPAVSLSPDSPVSVTTEAPGPLYYAVAPAENGEYVLTIRPGENVICRLYNGAWALLDSQIHMQDSAEIQLTYDLAGGETYYFEIMDLYGRVRTYEIGLTCTGSGQEFVLTPDKPVTVSLTQPGTAAWYTFVPQISGYYTLASDSDGGDTECQLYRYLGSDFSLVGYDIENYDNSDFSLYYYFLAGETYYFEVSHYDDNAVGEFELLLTYSGETTPSGKIGNWMAQFYRPGDLILGDDGIYRTPLGSTVYIAVNNHADGGVWALDGFTALDAVINAGEYLDLTYWDALTAGMDEDGYVVLTEETLHYLVTTISGNPDSGLTEAHAVLLLFYDAEPAEQEPEEQMLLGDVNGDGTVDTTDAYQIVLYYNERMELDEIQLAAADVSGDGAVDTTDAYYIVMFYNERIDSFPGEAN